MNDRLSQFRNRLVAIHQQLYKVIEDLNEYGKEQEDEEDSMINRWKLFLDRLKELNDPLLESLLRSGEFRIDNEVITLRWTKRHTFFKEWLDGSRAHWYPLLVALFGDIAVRYEFT